MIVSFADKQTEAFFHGRPSANPLRLSSGLQKAALRKLDMLNAAQSLLDLQSPPGNHLEALKGTLKGWYSIRVNDQWRVVFRFEGSNASDVRLLDYH